MMNKVGYPTVFTSSKNPSLKLNGALASQDIKEREVICAIPNKVCITTELAR